MKTSFHLKKNKKKFNKIYIKKENKIMPSAKKSKKSPSKSRSTAGMLLGSSSPSKSNSSKKRVVCGEKNGKLQCSTVDAKEVAMSEYGKKHLERKKKNCTMQAQLGLGVCDTEGDMHYFEEDAPTVHEEMDKDGNLIRFMILEPRVILELRKPEEKALTDVKAYLRKFNQNSIFIGPLPAPTPEEQEDFMKQVQNLVNAEKHNTNPDALKKVLISTPEEVRRKNTFRRYLACLVNDDVTSEIGAGFGNNLGMNLQAFSRVLLTQGLLQRVFEVIQNDRRDRVPGAPSEVSTSARLSILTNTGAFVFPLEDGFYFKNAVWEYSDSDSVRIKLPEPLAEKLAEKLALNELRNALNNPATTAAEAKKWIKMLAVNGSLVGSELSNGLIAMLLLDGGLTPSDLQMEDSACNVILQNSYESRAFGVRSRVGVPQTTFFRQIGKGSASKRVEYAKRIVAAANPTISEETRIAIIIAVARKFDEEKEAETARARAAGVGGDAIPDPEQEINAGTTVGVAAGLSVEKARQLAEQSSGALREGLGFRA